MFSIIWDKASNKKIDVDAGKEAIKRMLAKRTAGTIGFLDAAKNRAQLKKVKKVASYIQSNYDDFIVLGIGGSSLGGKTMLNALTNRFSPKRPKVTFVDNVDPEYFMDMLRSIDLKRTCFNVISKSGSTAETMAQFLVVYQTLCKELGKKEAVERIIITTDPEKGALRPLAKSMGFTMMDVPQNIGGRFSVLTDVGTLPAAVAGINVEAVFDGANEIADIACENDVDKNPVLKYALIKYAQAIAGKNISILMPYSTKLSDLSAWYVQLWAESLGKNGLGQTPIPAIGATDQHSQLQLFMEGPKDKFITFIGIKNPAQDVKIPNFDIDIEAFSYLSGHTMNELIRTEMISTEKALYENGVPSIRIELNKLDAVNVGALFMFFQVAVAITGELMGIDAFNQPGVELSKKYTYNMMGRRGY